MNAQITAADLIGQYVKLRDKTESMTRAFEETLAPYRAAMQVIEGVLTEKINALGPDGQSIKTAQGTAYRSTTLAVRCADRETFINWVFDNDLRDFVTAAVSKEACKEYLEKEKSAPPGVDVTYVHKTNIRRPG